MKNSKLVIFSLAAFVILLDQLAKILILSNMPHLIQKNYGIAFSLPIYGDFAIALTYIILGFGLFLAYKMLNFSRPFSIFAIGIIFGGAISNIIDRIFRGAVLDYINLKIWPVFNLADIFITIGILSLIIFYDKMKKQAVQRS